MFVEGYLKDLRHNRFAPHAWGMYVWRSARKSMGEAKARPELMRQVVMAGFLHLLVLFSISVWISFRIDTSLAQQFFSASAWWLLGGLAWISLHLGMFRHDEERPHSGLGLPNLLTLGRLLCVPAFYLFITSGWVWLALITFVVGGLTDVADGMAARRLGLSTKMGRVFDPLVDVLFNLFVAIGLTQAGYLPGWLLAIIGLRYGLLWVGGATIYFLRGPIQIRPTILGKTTGVVTAGLILAVVLSREILSPGDAESVVGLLHSTLGFVFALTVIQVVVLGWSNIKDLKSTAAAEGKLSVVVGQGVDNPSDHIR